jgi:hypothetical protein
MQEKIIGLIWRYGKNDYGVMMANMDGDDQEDLMRIYERYEEDSTNERGNMDMSLSDAGVLYWEDRFDFMEKFAKAKKLAHKLYNLGLVETSALYDDQADEQLTEAQILDALQKPKDTAYMLETFMQFCDGSQEEEDHKKFFDASMEIVHYMEDME